MQRQDIGNADETSWREAGKRVWLWTLTTSTAILYHIQARRGRPALLELLGPTWHGVLGCDRWSAYRHLPADRRLLNELLPVITTHKFRPVLRQCCLKVATQQALPADAASGERDRSYFDSWFLFDRFPVPLVRR